MKLPLRLLRNYFTGVFEDGRHQCGQAQLEPLDPPKSDGMVIGMATTKVTITLDNEQLAAVRKLVSQGKSSNVSSFIQHAVAVSLSDVAGWGAMLGLALKGTGGPLTAKERTWADSVLGVAQPQRQKRSHGYMSRPPHDRSDLRKYKS